MDRWFSPLLWYLEVRENIKKLNKGECPDCHVILEEVPGWGRSDCPKCKKHYKWF